MKTAFFMLGSLMLVAGCNTMQGLGTDIKNLGTNLHTAASNGKQQPPSQTPNPAQTRSQAYPVQPLESRELETMPYEKYDSAR